MKTLILYESIYGTTHQYSKWLAERIPQASTVAISSAPALDEYKNVILGYPVYMDKVMPAIRTFILKHRAELQRKQVGLFVVCMDKPVSFFHGKLHGAFQLLDTAIKMFDFPLIHAAAFPGEINPSKLSSEHWESLLGFYRNILKQPMSDVSYKTGVNKMVCWEYAETFLSRIGGVQECPVIKS